MTTGRQPRQKDSNFICRADLFLRKIYELYADFAIKNPLYFLEMPITACKSLKTLTNNSKS